MPRVKPTPYTSRSATTPSSSSGKSVILKVALGVLTVLVLGGAFVGYRIYSFISLGNRYESELPAQVTARIHAQGYPTSCTEVDINHFQGGHFTGYAEFANGERRHISVEENTGEWQIDDPQPLSMRP